MWYPHRKSATATAKTLDTVVERIKLLNPDAVKILGVLNPLASCLLRDQDFNKFEVAGILHQLRGYSRRA